MFRILYGERKNIPLLCDIQSPGLEETCERALQYSLVPSQSSNGISSHVFAFVHGRALHFILIFLAGFWLLAGLEPSGLFDYKIPDGFRLYTRREVR